jgi:hypothetical protein
MHDVDTIVNIVMKENYVYKRVTKRIIPILLTFV